MTPKSIQEVPVDTVTGLAALNLGPFRLCEWAILIVSALVLLRLPVIAAPDETAGMSAGRWGVALLLTALLATHAAAEGTRWQMVPVYAAALTALLLLLVPSSETWPRLVRWPVGLIGLGAVGASAVLAVMVPLFRLPPPMGPLAVGTRLYQVVDDTRAEFHSQRDAPRRLMMQLWYPAEPQGGAGPAAYRTGALWNDGRWAISRFWQLSHQRLVPTQAYAEAPLLPGAQPRGVVIFAHAWGGTRGQNTALMQDLASRGYIVAAFDRPYNASYVAFPDGKLITIPDDMVLDTSSDSAREDTLLRGAREAATGAADAAAVLDALAWLDNKDSGSPFAGQIAADRAAIIGHSFGGAVAAEACRADKRFVAAMNLDGWIFGAARQFGVPCLYMLMNDGDPVPSVSAMSMPDPATRNNARMQIEDQQAQLHSLMQHGGWDLTLAGASHEDFTDRPFYALAHHLTNAGTLPPGRVDEITRRYAAALVGLALDHRASPWLQSAPPGYPEVSFRAWPQPSAQPLPGQEIGG